MAPKFASFNLLGVFTIRLLAKIYVCIQEIENTEYMFSISFRKHRNEKKEKKLLTLIIIVKILFARAITTSTARASSVSPSSYTNTILNQSARVLS